MNGTHESDIITINMFRSKCLKSLFIFVGRISSAIQLNCRKSVYTKYFSSQEWMGLYKIHLRLSDHIWRV